MSIMPDEYHSDKKVWLAGLEEGAKREQARIVELLEIGGPIEKIICDYWGDPGFDKEDALVLIAWAIKRGTE